MSSSAFDEPKPLRQLQTTKSSSGFDTERDRRAYLEPPADWTDDQVVQHIRDCAIKYSKCGFNTIKANQIMDKELRPYEVLKRKGDAALRKLLPLLNDTNSTVQWVAAGFVYDIEPAAC